MQGGSFEFYVAQMVGEDLLPCVWDLWDYVTGSGDAAKICDSSTFASSFSKMAFGSTPNVDCLPLSTAANDPNVFLRDPVAPLDGSCSLPVWDAHDADVAAVEAHNDALLRNATLAAENTTAPLPEWPWWREILLPALPIAQALLIFLGNLRLKGTQEGGNMAAVTPVSVRGSIPVEGCCCTSHFSNLLFPRPRRR
jgi:hypothetical protein